MKEISINRSVGISGYFKRFSDSLAIGIVRAGELGDVGNLTYPEIIGGELLAHT